MAHKALQRDHKAADVAKYERQDDAEMDEPGCWGAKDEDEDDMDVEEAPGACSPSVPPSLVHREPPGGHSVECTSRAEHMCLSCCLALCRPSRALA